MNNYGDLLPAYGRDYKTAKEAKESFLAGKDWIISSFFHPYSGKPININDARKDGASSVVLRFCRQTKIARVNF